MNILFLGAAPAAPKTDDNRFPVWLAESGKTSLLEKTTASFIAHEGNHLIYCFLASDIEKFHLHEVVTAINSQHTVISVKNPTQGAACTALLAADSIDNESELFVIGLNEFLDVDLAASAEEFKTRDLDAATLVFKSVHPRYSFVRLGADDLVIEAVQGRPISNIATTAAFWFRQGKDFVAGAKEMIRKQDQHDGIYYICPVLNQLILKGRRIGVTQLAPGDYHPLKTDAQIHHFEFEE